MDTRILLSYGGLTQLRSLMALLLGCWPISATLAIDTEFALGSLTLDTRYRLELVDQDNALKDATASTLRTRIGFETKNWNGLYAVVEAEDVSAIGADDFNSTTNGNTEFSVVPDPDNTEINQAYLGYWLGDTELRVGRQRMGLDNQRFIGSAAFRQNEQTFDAAVLMNRSLSGQRFIYAFMDKVQRPLGNDNPAGEVDMSTHVLHYLYSRLNGDQLSAYGYLLELDDEALAGRSQKTFGLRYVGRLDFDSFDFLYEAEYADQSDYKQGAATNDADYLRAVAGVKLNNQWVIKVGQERLGGNGTYGFQTPLATRHAFNGFADIFASVTPPAGLIDTFVEIGIPLFGAQFSAAYHDFVPDAGDKGYGREIDFDVTRKFGTSVSLGLQYANYRSEGFDVDTEKLWLWFGFAL